MEYMDAGSLDKLEAGGIPEDVLGRITGAMVRGLKFLKDDMQIIHRGACLMHLMSQSPLSSSPLPNPVSIVLRAPPCTDSGLHNEQMSNLPTCSSIGKVK